MFLPPFSVEHGYCFINSGKDCYNNYLEHFCNMLLFSGGSSAQFRFHDEEDWESTGVSPATTASVLTMNLEDLHQGLSCIPLHHRLGIPECLFSVSQYR